MSASREKKKRQALNQSGAPRAAASAVKKTPTWKVVLYWAIGVLFVISFFAVILFNSSFFAKHTTAVTVGDHKVSPAMLDIYYTNAYTNFYSNYQDYISYFFDTSKSLDEQIYDEETGETWADFFLDSAKSSMTQSYTLYDLAKAEGYQLTAEEKQSIDATIASFKETAPEYGYSSANGYLAASFGNGVTTSIYRDFLETQYLAADYYTQKLDSYSFTEEDKVAFYAEHADLYNTLNASYCAIDGTAEATVSTDEDGVETSVDPTDEEIEAAMEDARKLAKAILDGKDAMEDHDVHPMADYTKESVGYTLPAEAVDWLFDAARVEGDMESFESDSFIYVVRFESLNDNDYLTRNIRLVQMTAAAVNDVLDADGNVDQEATEAAKEAALSEVAKKARQAYEDWQDGDATEDSFITMAETYSDGAVSSADGGLLENITKFDFSDADFNDWLFDASRAAGDTELFTGETCYIVYYLGEGENAQCVATADDIVNDAFNTWYEEASSSYAASEHSFGMRFIDKH